MIKIFFTEPCGYPWSASEKVPEIKSFMATCSNEIPDLEISCPEPVSVVGLNFFPKKCTVLKSGKEKNSKAYWIYFWSDGKFFTLKSDEPLPAFIKDGALVDFEWQVKNGASIAKMHEVKL